MIDRQANHVALCRNDPVGHHEIVRPEITLAVQDDKEDIGGPISWHGRKTLKRSSVIMQASQREALHDTSATASDLRCADTVARMHVSLFEMLCEVEICNHSGVCSGSHYGRHPSRSVGWNRTKDATCRTCALWKKHTMTHVSARVLSAVMVVKSEIINGNGPGKEKSLTGACFIFFNTRFDSPLPSAPSTCETCV